MPDPKKKPIIVDSKNDLRYKSYNDSLNLYKAYKFQKENQVADKTMLNITKKKVGDISKKNVEYKPNQFDLSYMLSQEKLLDKITSSPNYNEKELKKVYHIEDKKTTPSLKNLNDYIKYNQIKKNNSGVTKSSEKILKYYKSLGIDDKNIGFYDSPDVYNKNIKPIASYFDGYASSPIYKKPTQPVELEKLIEKPKEKLTPIQPLIQQGIQQQNIQADIPIIRQQTRIPKYYNVTDKVNQNSGGSETSYKVDKLEDLPSKSNLKYEDGTEYNSRKITPQYAMGGYLNMKKYENGGQLTQFNEGGLHEQNPNGGVPIGNNNTVEQGETKKGNYVYSNRLYINEDLVKQYNLPNSIKGKTFADASKIIEKPFVDKNSNPDKLTLKEHLQRLQNAQENLKQQEQQRATQMAQEMTQNQISNNQEVPQGMEEYAEGNQNNPQEEQVEQNDQQVQSKYGGFINKYADGGEIGIEGINPYMAGAEGGLTALTQLTNGNKNQALNSVAKTGLSIGADALLPGSGQFVGPVYDMVSGMLKKPDNSTLKNNTINTNNQFSDTFKYGGFVNKMYKGGPIPIDESLDGYNPNWKDNLTNKYINNDYGPQVKPNTPDYMKNYERTPGLFPNSPYIGDQGVEINNLSEKNGMAFPAQFDKTTTNMGVNPNKSSFLNKVGTTVKNNYGEALRYAPIAANIAQGLMLKKPKIVNPEILTNRYKPSYLDENTMLNQVKEQSQNTNDALVNASNGSEAGLRANLLGNQINSLRGRSEVYSKIKEYNNGQDQYGQTFDLGIDKDNIASKRYTDDLNEQNKANYRNQLSKIIGQTGTDLGEIGKEKVYNKKVGEMFGYDENGKYLLGPKGEKIRLNATVQNKYGGFLKTNKKGY